MTTTAPESTTADTATTTGHTVVTVRADDLAATIKAALTCAYPKSDLPAINAVRLSVENSLHGEIAPVLAAAATDRISLAISEARTLDVTGDPANFAALIPVAATKPLMAWLKSLPKHADVSLTSPITMGGHVEHRPDSLTITEANGPGINVVPQVVGPQFPAVRALLAPAMRGGDAPERTLPGSLSYNPDVLARFTSANLRRPYDPAKREASITFVLPETAHKPLGIRYSDHFTALVMPRRAIA